MNKKYLFSFALLFISLAYFFHIDRVISNNLSIMTNKIKIAYINTKDTIYYTVHRYYQQSHTIKNLQAIVDENEKYKALYLSSEHNQTKTQDLNLTKIQVLSYINFDDFSKVLLNTDENVTDQISALITQNGFSAGIARFEEGRYVALLNHNANCNYSVFIGKDQVPGITSGNPHQEYITIQYIPIWQQINEGDEVITSGMDNIFYKGVKVGKVVAVRKLIQTQEADVKPYADVYNKEYFYRYKRTN